MSTEKKFSSDKILAIGVFAGILVFTGLVIIGLTLNDAEQDRQKLQHMASKSQGSATTNPYKPSQSYTGTAQTQQQQQLRQQPTPQPRKQSAIDFISVGDPYYIDNVFNTNDRVIVRAKDSGSNRVKVLYLTGDKQGDLDWVRPDELLTASESKQADWETTKKGFQIFMEIIDSGNSATSQ